MKSLENHVERMKELPFEFRLDIWYPNPPFCFIMFRWFHGKTITHYGIPPVYPDCGLLYAHIYGHQIKWGILGQTPFSRKTRMCDDHKFSLILVDVMFLYSMVRLTCIIVVYIPNRIIYIYIHVTSGPDTQKTCIHVGLAISLEDSKVITHWKIGEVASKKTMIES